nr:hypothetical protein [Oscillospiraceae bacterium]
MARTTPVHSGYTILNGVGSGTNGGRIDVWVEYKLGQQSVSGNHTPVTAYFYAALNPSYTASTAYSSGLNSTFTVDGKAGTTVSNGAYDFTSSAKVNLLGSFTGNIAHGSDGTKKLTFAGSFTTLSSYISGGSIDKTVTLPTIPRAAQVAAQGSVLGQACCVSWTPALASHSFALEFSLGDFSLTTGRLYPNTTGKYTYTATTLPLEIARQFTGKTGTMTVKLTTYSGNTALGTDTATFTVTVPENEATRPTVTTVLTPVCDAFPGIYVQGLGKVQANVTATDPLGATITGYSLTVGNATTQGTVSEYLSQSGTLAVTVTAVSSRGFAGVWEGEIEILPYDSPRLTQASACRCLSDGTADPGGTYLRIVATQSYSNVAGENASCIRWRYKPDGGNYSDWKTLTAEASIDTVLNLSLGKDMAYTVQLGAIDTPGGTCDTTFSIPMEQVYMHRTPNAMGLGGYAEGEKVLDVHWDLRTRKSLSGAYIRTVPERKSFTLTFPEGGTALLLGGSVYGTVRLSGGTAVWNGTAGVSVAAEGSVVTVTLPQGSRILILSPDPIEI